MLVTANAATAILKLAAGDRKAGDVRYRLKGQLSTKIGLLRTIPFEETGTVPIADLLGKRRKGG
jgi:hypothetical protein